MGKSLDVLNLTSIGTCPVCLELHQDLSTHLHQHAKEDIISSLFRKKKSAEDGPSTPTSWANGSLNVPKDAAGSRRPVQLIVLQQPIGARSETLPVSSVSKANNVLGTTPGAVASTVTSNMGQQVLSEATVDARVDCGSTSHRMPKDMCIVEDGIHSLSDDDAVIQIGKNIWINVPKVILDKKERLKEVVKSELLRAAMLSDNEHKNGENISELDALDAQQDPLEISKEDIQRIGKGQCNSVCKTGVVVDDLAADDLYDQGVYGEEDFVQSYTSLSTASPVADNSNSGSVDTNLSSTMDLDTPQHERKNLSKTSSNGSSFDSDPADEPTPSVYEMETESALKKIRFRRKGVQLDERSEDELVENGEHLVDKEIKLFCSDDEKNTILRDCHEPQPAKIKNASQAKKTRKICLKFNNIKPTSGLQDIHKVQTCTGKKRYQYRRDTKRSWNIPGLYRYNFRKEIAINKDTFKEVPTPTEDNHKEEEEVSIKMEEVEPFDCSVDDSFNKRVKVEPDDPSTESEEDVSSLEATKMKADSNCKMQLSTVDFKQYFRNSAAMGRSGGSIIVTPSGWRNIYHPDQLGRKADDHNDCDGGSIKSIKTYSPGSQKWRCFKSNIAVTEATCPKDGVIKTESTEEDVDWTPLPKKSLKMLSGASSSKGKWRALRGIFECPVCPLVYTNMESVRIHMDSILRSPFACGLCHQIFGNIVEKNQHITLHAREEYACLSCDRNNFSGPREWREHQLSHCGLKSFHCTECGYYFSTNRDLVMHLLREHSADRLHLCVICNVRFSTKESLKRHLTRMHVSKCYSGEMFSEDKYKDCFFLQEQNTRPKSRDKREIIKFKCSICDMVFPTNKQVDLHKMEVHPVWTKKCMESLPSAPHLANYSPQNINEKILKATVPGVHSSLNFKSNSPSKMQKGTDDKVCRCKSYDNTWDLKNHRCAQAGVKERPHKCRLCDKSFESERYLLLHIRAHRNS